MTRKRVFAFVALLLGLILGLLGAELLLRTGKLGWLSQAPLPNTIDPDMSQHRLHPDPNIAWEMKPNSSGEVLGSGTITNSFGCRGPEPKLDPRPDLFLVSLGDSMTVGLSVLGPKTFSGQLEQILAEQGVNAVVMNCGVAGYNLEQALRRFDAVVAPHKPDGVIVSYFVDDYLPPYEMMDGGLRSRLRVDSALFRAAEIIWDAFWDGKIGNAKADVARTHDDYPRRVIEYASGWHQRRKEEGVRVIAVLHATLEHPHPVTEQGKQSRADQQTRFIPDLEEHGVPWFRTEPLYIEAVGINGFADISIGIDPNASLVDRVMGLDPHPNAKGHRLIAEELASQIRSLGWLDKGIPAAAEAPGSD